MKILTPDNYYEPDEYMSVSAFKRLEKCEASNEFDGSQETTDAMLIGSYVDAYIEGTLEKFKSKHPEIFASRGVCKGELKMSYKNADEICAFISKDNVFSQFMSGEKQRIMTGEIAGIPFKIKMDSYSPNIAINDLKVMATITDRKGYYYDFITPWGYDLQLGAYQEIVRQNTGKKLLCYICAVTKETPINSVIVNVPQVILDKAVYHIEEKIQHLYDVKTGKVEAVGCGICDICIKKRTSTPIISLLDIMQ